MLKGACHIREKFKSRCDIKFAGLFRLRYPYRELDEKMRHSEANVKTGSRRDKKSEYIKFSNAKKKNGIKNMSELR